MALYTVWMLEKSNITITPGGDLSGVGQGDGSHLLNRTITLNNGNYLETFIEDNDPDFEDNDTTQSLGIPPGSLPPNQQDINGGTYNPGTRVEAEYRLILQDNSVPPRQWTVYGYNVNNSNPAYATVEGLAFRPAADGSFPPIGTPLRVIFTSEGPSGAGSNPYFNFADPPCFTPGTLINTPTGPRPIESLRPGDLVLTRDNGPQPLRWIGRTRLSPAELAISPQHRPVRIAAGILGEGLPQRPLTLSPQHRLLFSGWRAELLFGEAEVLVPAIALVGDRAEQSSDLPDGVDYLHLLFDRHEIIYAEGAPVESLLPDWIARTDLAPALRAELAELLARMGPEAAPLANGAARNCLTVREGRLFA